MASPVKGTTQVPAPCPPGTKRLTGRLCQRTRPARRAGPGRRWLMLAAEMAGLANGGWRPSPDPVSAGRPGMPRIATRALGADAGSVRTARDFTSATLHRWGTAERSQDIVIVVSELLTNALRHALPGSGDMRPGRPIRLGLLQPGPCVLCAVADPSKLAPAPRAPGSLAETGRGLHIICALSDQWGFAPSDTGKVVWAMFYPRLGSRWLILGHAARLSSRRARWLVRCRSSGVPFQKASSRRRLRAQAMYVWSSRVLGRPR